MVEAKEVVKTKEVPIMDAGVFLREPEGGSSGSGPTHTIRFDKDSYIICFEGRRGGGKTTAMSFFVVRAVALYNMRVISNFPIEFMLRRHRPDGKTYLQHVKAEPLDFYKLICFDEEYKNVLICIDEAPDIISHMASLSWRNRLVAAFTRQLRKNYNTLFLAAQDFALIDKSMRWQVDVIVKCQDVARVVGDDSKLERGEMLRLNFYDESGQWTGKSTEDRIRYRENPSVLKLQLFPRVMWGDAEHEPVFNSWYQIDILDSLRKVDLRMSSIKVGDKADSDATDRYPVSLKTLRAVLETYEMIFQERPDDPNIWQTNFYDSFGAITDADKNNLGKVLTRFDVERGRDTSNGKRWLGFGSFDIESFRAYVQSKAEGVSDGDISDGDNGAG